MKDLVNEKINSKIGKGIEKKTDSIRDLDNLDDEIFEKIQYSFGNYKRFIDIVYESVIKQFNININPDEYKNKEYKKSTLNEKTNRLYENMMDVSNYKFIDKFYKILIKHTQIKSTLINDIYNKFGYISIDQYSLFTTSLKYYFNESRNNINIDNKMEFPDLFWSSTNNGITRHGTLCTTTEITKEIVSSYGSNNFNDYFNLSLSPHFTGFNKLQLGRILNMHNIKKMKCINLINNYSSVKLNEINGANKRVIFYDYMIKYLLGQDYIKHSKNILSIIMYVIWCLFEIYNYNHNKYGSHFDYSLECAGIYQIDNIVFRYFEKGSNDNYNDLFLKSKNISLTNNNSSLIQLGDNSTFIKKICGYEAQIFMPEYYLVPESIFDLYTCSFYFNCKGWSHIMNERIISYNKLISDNPKIIFLTDKEVLHDKYSCESRTDFLKKIKYLFVDYIEWRSTYVKYTDFRNNVLTIRFDVKPYDYIKKELSNIYNIGNIKRELTEIYTTFFEFNELCLQYIKLFLLIKIPNNPYIKDPEISKCEFHVKMQEVKNKKYADLYGGAYNDYIQLKNS